jgi:hypothetical protein
MPGKRRLSVDLPEDVYELVTGYAASNGVGLGEAVADLLRKGYEYADLEKRYGKSVHDREVWDRRYYFLKVESAYLYYRLRLRELYEEVRTLAMNMSSLVSALEHVVRRCGLEDRTMDEYLSRMRSVAKHYIDSYVLSSRELQDTPEVSDAEVVRSIEEVLERYKQVLLQEKR